MIYESLISIKYEALEIDQELFSLSVTSCCCEI